MSQPAPLPPPPGLDLGAFLVALRQQRTIAISFFFAVVLVALAATTLTTPTYKALALIQLMPQAGLEVAVEEVVRSDVGGYLEVQQRARTQIQIIQSRTVLEKVIEQYTARGFTDFTAGPDGARALARSLVVQPRENTQLVEIVVTHHDPARAAVLANLIAEVYFLFNLEARTDAARESKGWIDTRILGARAELADASAAALAFRQEFNVVDIEEEVNGITSRLESLQRALGEATTQRVLTQSALDNHLRLLNRGEFLVLAGMFLSDPTLDTISKERASIVVESAEVLARYGERHPEHERAVERIAHVDALLAEAVRARVDGERSQVRTFTRQEQEIEQELQQVKTELLERQRLQREYDALKLDEDRGRALYHSLKDRVTEVDLQAHSELNDVRIVDRAIQPAKPSSPDLPLNLAVAMMVGLMGGLGLVVARQRFTSWPAAAASAAPGLSPYTTASNTSGPAPSQNGGTTSAT